MATRHPRETRVVTRIVGEFSGFRRGNLYVFEHEPDRVWVQVSHLVEERVFRIDPAAVLRFDLRRCATNGVEQYVLSVECCESDVLVERVRGRRLPLDARPEPPADPW